jgi:hypothetical protein
MLSISIDLALPSVSGRVAMLPPVLTARFHRASTVAKLISMSQAGADVAPSARSLSLTVSRPSAYLRSKLRSRFRRWLGFLLRLSQQNLKKSPPKLGGDLERMDRKGEAVTRKILSPSLFEPVRTGADSFFLVHGSPQIVSRLGATQMSIVPSRKKKSSVSTNPKIVSKHHSATRQGSHQFRFSLTPVLKFMPGGRAATLKNLVGTTGYGSLCSSRLLVGIHSCNLHSLTNSRVFCVFFPNHDAPLLAVPH